MLEDFCYQSKTIIDLLPFIQQMIDTLQQYGEDRVEVAVNHRQSTIEIQVTVPDSSILYN